MLAEPGMTPILSLQDVQKTYGMRRAWFARRAASVRAVDHLSLEIAEASCFGLVGESGSGKSTLAQLITGLITPSGGRLLFRGGEPVSRPRREVQMVFQDTQASLNPRKRIRRTLDEALAAAAVPRSDRPARLAELLRQVGLDDALLPRFAHEISGGQRQRVGIARALAMAPSLLVADEPVASLDVSLQGQIINLLRDINRTLQLSIIVISHDLAVIGHMCDRVGVMFAGRLVELGPTARVLQHPAHPYTQALLQAVPRGPGGHKQDRARSPAAPAEEVPADGCHYRHRCAAAQPVCARRAPALLALAAEHSAACHLVPGLQPVS